MDIGTVVWFFAEKAGTAVLNKLIDRVFGESHHINDALEVIGHKQDELLENMRDQIEAHYKLGLMALQQASNTTNESGYRAYLRSAVREFSYCASVKHFAGFRRAQIFVELAICHHLLEEPRNARAALKEGLRVAQDAAKQRGEVYVRERTSQSIEIRLPDGRTVHGIRWEQRDVPQLRDGALALARQISEALQFVKAH